MRKNSAVLAISTILIWASCAKEQETADALVGSWEITEVQLNDSTFLTLPQLPYMLEIPACEEAYTATCRAYLDYGLNDTSNVYSKTDSLKFDIRDKEITFTDAQNESKFSFLLQRFVFSDPKVSPLVLTKTGFLEEGDFPVTLKLIKK